MEKNFLWTLFLCGVAFCSKAQTSQPVDTIKVAYMDINDPQGFVLSEATVHLSTTSGVSKVYFKIINPTDSSVVYDVNYAMSASLVTDASGLPLCLIDGTSVQVINPNPLPLQAYTYQVQTEDANGNKSTAYTILQNVE